ncbi:MAG: hypothetical protein IKA44_03840 [Clostridia bacterium]|nr:hypothetical protein [Clostridia bacterium]
MSSIADKKKQTLMKRRKRAILLCAIAVILLAVALVFVMDYVQTITVEDVDGTTYYIRKKDGVYALYDADRNLLKTDEAYGYYVTALGTLIRVDAETGEHEIFAVLDTEGNEVYDLLYARTLIFPHLQREDILSLEIHNSNGDDYVFLRYNEETGEMDANGDFVLLNSPSSAFDPEKFSSLIVNTGYAMSTMKLKDPIKDANGEFSEYGLVPETRIDENGKEYAYEPAYFIVTEVNGEQHKIILGDMLVPKTGYYAQYVSIGADGTETKRDAVYVLDMDAGADVLATVEHYVTPMLTYPMELTNFVDVKNFKVYQRIEGSKAGDDAAVMYGKPVVNFSYVDFSLRENTLKASYPYVFAEELDGYTPSFVGISECLQGLYDPALVQVCKLGPSLEDMAKYGLYAPLLNEDETPKTDEKGNILYGTCAEYTFSFDFEVKDDDGNVLHTMNHMVLVSDKKLNEKTGEYEKTGSYYAYTMLTKVTEDENGKRTYEETELYNMIVEVEDHTLNFLTWDSYEWINGNYIIGNIVFLTEINVETKNYQASFFSDNSLSDTTDSLNSNHLSVTASDSNGKTADTIGLMKVTDKNGYIWHVSPTGLKVFDASGKELEMAEGVPYYANNAMGRQALCRNGYIECPSYRVEVTANTVRVLYHNGREEVHCRYQSELFKSFYQTLATSTIAGAYEMTDEAEAALVSDPSKLLLTLTVKTRDVDGKEYTLVCRFYEIEGAPRKAYITINGNGGFYVMRSRVDKIVGDAQNVFDLKLIDPMAKT